MSSSPRLGEEDRALGRRACRAGSWSSLKSNRTGFGLLHTVLLMVVLGLLMSLTAIVLGKSFQTYQATLTHFQTVHRLRRASDRWRSDVHRADSVEVDGDLLRLNLPIRGEVVYRLDEGDLERSFGSDDRSDGNGTLGPATQKWKMPATTQISWELRDAEGEEQRFPLLVATLIFAPESKTAKGADPSRSRTESALGLGEISWIARVGVDKRIAALGKTSSAKATKPSEPADSPEPTERIEPAVEEPTL